AAGCGRAAGSTSGLPLAPATTSASSRSKATGGRGAPGPPSLPSGPDVLLLCLDTATPQVSVAIGDEGAVRGEIRLGRGRRHAEQLAPAIAYLCHELDVELARLAGIAVGLGPGLFTRLRVGVTAASAMAQALGEPRPRRLPPAAHDPARRRGARRPPGRGLSRPLSARARRRAAGG